MSVEYVAVRCPNCGAKIDLFLDNDSVGICKYCNTKVLRTNTENQFQYINNRENFSNLSVDNILYRCGYLLVKCDDKGAKELIGKALVYYPNDNRLQEVENECDTFLTKNFGSYIKMLSIKTFFIAESYNRYINEMEAFLGMLSNKADNKLNFPIFRKQNNENYNYIYGYLIDIKRCLENKEIIKHNKLYNELVKVLLKFSTILCNTIYISNQNKKQIYIKLIDAYKRKILIHDFELFSNYFNTSNFKIVDEVEWEKY